MDSHDSLIDLIFTKCSLVYGRDFMGRWEGLDIGEVKADWYREIGHMSPHAILYGLERLPADKPPNVLQFRALCIGAPSRLERQNLALPSPETIDPVGKARITEMLKGTRAKLLGVA